MAANGPEIIKRRDRMKNKRYNFDERWERMAPFIAPSRRGINTQWSPGEKQTQGVYDSTTLMAAELMAMFIAGHIINPSQQWMGYRMRQADANQHDEVKEWLEECRDRTLKRLTASMFYAEGPESLIDYGGFGTGCLISEEAPQPVNRIVRGFRGFYFHAEKTGRFYIEEGADGLVDTLFRDFELSARVIDERWGGENQARLPENVRQAIQKGEMDKGFKMVHAIYPRSRADQNGYTGNGMPWASCWVEEQSKSIISEGGYRTFPAAIPRYHRTPGEVYGRGRGDLAFPDTWTLNTAKRMGLEDWALKIRPPVLVRSDSVIGTLRLTPAGPTSINTHGGSIKDSIMPFETGSRPEVSALKEEELRKSIRGIFYVDQILALLEVSKSEMTAFEFARKIELLFRLLGPVYGRLEWEYLYRVVDTVFDILLAAGEFSPPPPEVMMTDGQIDIEFQNPIAKAQRAGDAEAIMMAVNDLAPLGQIFPQMWDRIDPDKTALGVLEIRGVPARWTRSDKEMMALREERQKQNQQDLELERTAQLAEAAGKAAPALTAMAGNGRPK
jgi:hypothetical protein